MKKVQLLQKKSGVWLYFMLGIIIPILLSTFVQANIIWTSLDECVNQSRDFDRELCMGHVAAHIEDVSICEDISIGHLKDHCYFLVENAIERNNAENTDKIIRKYVSPVFYPTLFLIVLLLYFSFKSDKKRTLNRSVFLLAIPIALGRYLFKWDKISWLAGGDANLNSVILLLFVIYVFIVATFNLNRIFKKWKEKDNGFIKDLKRFYLSIFLFTIIISIVSFFDPEIIKRLLVTSLESLGSKDLWIFLTLFGTSGGSFLFMLGVSTSVYLIKASILEKTWIKCITMLITGKYLKKRTKGIKSKRSCLFIFHLFMISLIFLVLFLWPFLISIFFWSFGIPKIG